MKGYRKLLSIILIAVLVTVQPGMSVQAASVRPADVEEAAQGNLLVGVSGKFEHIEKDKILKELNRIRKDACKKGYLNPATGHKLSMEDYTDLKWSSDLEWIAQLRAAESTVYEDHQRPNGSMCFDLTYHGTHTQAENLAWNYSGLMRGIAQWEEEKKDWAKQNYSAVTGHYTAIINPSYRYVGIGSFVRSSGGWYGVAAEFSSVQEADEAQSDLKGSYIQTIEVSAAKVQKETINAPSSIKKGKKKTLAVIRKVKYPGISGGTNTTNGRYMHQVEWKSSDPDVLSVDAGGRITAKKVGKATITAKLSNNKKIKAVITVKK